MQQLYNGFVSFFGSATSSTMLSRKEREEESDQCNTECKPPANEFTDLVLSWSSKEIFDDNLYKNQVEKIPQSFESVDQYLGSYVFPLLEETRAGIASAMKTIDNAPFAAVTSLTELTHEQLLHSVEVDFWRNRINEYGREWYRTLPGDIVLLSDLHPESHSYLGQVARPFALAYVTNVSGDESGENCTSSSFKVKAAKSIDVGAIQRKSFYVVFLMNLTTNRRQWNSLRMRKNPSTIEKVLCKNELDMEHRVSCSMKCSIKMEVDFEPTLSSRLNESQINAISSCLVRAGCKHRASVELIWGPPGTGKTRTITVLLYNLLKMRVRTLICAPTDEAITELASRLVSLSRESFRDEQEMFLSCPLGDILIFGNKDTLKIGSNIEEIFLDYRVNKLVECLVSPTGLKHWISSMLDFLDDHVSQNHTYVDNKLIKAQGNDGGDIRQSEFKSSMKNARNLFKGIATSLRESLSTFITHLPRSSILGQNFQNMGQLMSHLESIETLLFEDKLDMVFLRQGVISSQSSFAYLRNDCLSTLRSLQSSLTTLSLPRGTNKTKISDSCFQKASLIFCTISSSYTLHSMDINPLDLVVIDEAAQVKESESIIALQIPNVRHAILVGDDRQLQTPVNSKLSEHAGFGKSLFGRLSSLCHSKHLLNMQYSMHPSISRFPNSNFYGNQILDAPSVQSKSYERCYLQGRMFGPYSFIDIPGGKEEVDDVGQHRRNMLEVAVTLKIVQKLFKAWKRSKEKLSIGVISPYAAQVAAIRDGLKLNYEILEGFAVKVDSIDGFQRGEQDIIIISTVRSNKGGSIGFLSDPQRINVALTRARHCLWILGDEGTLSKSGSVWEALIRDAKHRQCFFTATDDLEIRRTVITVKKELDQLQELPNGESILFNHAGWKVTFSDNFRKSFRKLRPSYVKKWVITMLLKIASGWRPKKTNVDLECGSSSYVVKQFKVQGYYVLCSIDIVKDSIWTQVLKVWDVLPLVEIPKLLKRLGIISAMFTEDYINRCKEKCIEGDLEVPKTWASSDGVVQFKNLNGTKSITNPAGDSGTYVENSKVSESLLLMKFYSLSSGSAKHLLSDYEGREVELPFEISNEERETVLFPKSSFILGRSGTGKTTVLTMKLFQKQQQYLIASMGTPNKMFAAERVDHKQCQDQSTLRQLFVTVSPKLCHAVRGYVSQLRSFACGDFSANSSFTDTDDIEEVAEFKDIPDTFVGIQPEKYPLIITFHKFLMMFDGTLGNSYFERFPGVRDSSQYECRSLRSVAFQTFMRKNEVTYDRFSSLYWPHFSTNLTKNLDPSRVFTEIMSHIKVSVQAGEACDVTRNRQGYISLSKSRVSTLSVERREVIYDIYQVYEKMKMKRGEFDVADFVNDIHLRLSKKNLACDKMDYVYIDEVQDLNMGQISLFRHICNNVDEGFVFSGDTAQTVARGIDFRFQDIRSLFYNEFIMKSGNSQYPGRGEKGLISDVFSLCQNFRTHIGVLRLAQSVIDLLYHFFPSSVDALTPETSFIHGESPVALELGSDENSILTIFGSGGSVNGKWIGFGAEQVVLVRDDSARKEIAKYIGQQALVLTIVESKGLEFQDVLLYNFFGSSPLSSQWRVLYEFLKQKDLFDPNFPNSFPCFSPSRHKLSKPMFDYWQRLGLMQIRKLDEAFAAGMQRISSPEEWESQGIKLFWERNYEMATMCFERAGKAIWEKRAKASWLRSSADHLRISNPTEARKLVREAAKLFVSIGRAAAECLCDFGDYKTAGMIYLNKCGTPELRKAAECFTLAGCYKTAAEVYAKGNWFTECLSACMKGKLFKMGLQYMEFWEQQSPCNTEIVSKLNDIVKIKQEFLESGALEYHRIKNEVLFMKFVRAFGTIESKRKFLRSLDCLQGLLILEKESRNLTEAAEIAKLMGDVLVEVDLLVTARNFADASTLILSYVLSNSIWVSANQGWPLKLFRQKEKLLSKLMSFAEEVSGNFHASICTETKILSHERMNLFELMESYIASRQCKSRTGEMLCVRKLLDVHFGIYAAEYEWDHELPDDLKGYSEEKMSRNKVSVRTLVYIWNLFKENSLEIIECLGCLESGDTHKFKGAIEFCLSYFGVRLSCDSSNTCLLMIPNAKWVENVHKTFMHRNRKVVALHVHDFVSAARGYWCRELVSVGFQVLEALRSLYKFFVVKNSSMYCQGICLTFIFDITKFLIESKSLDSKKSEYSKLQEFLQLSTKYFEIAFPLDPRQSLSVNLITLRETEVSKSLLEEIICRYTNTKPYYTFREIGNSVMIWLGSGKPRHDLCERMVRSLPKNSHWKAFIEILGSIMKPEFPMRSASSNLAPQAIPDTSSGKGTIQSGSSHNSPSSSSAECLSRRLYKALEETCTDNNISPNCFLYLLERLLILTPHPHGCFFTTKSSFAEWIVNQQPNANPSVSLATDMEFSLTNIDDFFIGVVNHFLDKDIDCTKEWIRQSNIGYNYFPVLVIRLIVILCLVCLNSQMSLDILFELLTRPLIGSHLPKQFSETLMRGKGNNDLSIVTVAGALKAIGDPLVIVIFGENNFNFVCPDAILLDLRLFQCKSDIIHVLFPRSTGTSNARVSSGEGNEAESGTGLSGINHIRGKSAANQSLEMMPETESNSGSENAKLEQHLTCGFLGDISDMLLFCRSKDNGNLETIAQEKKVKIGENMNFLAAALLELTEQKSPFSMTNKSMSCEATDTIEELKQLSSLLDRSNMDGQDLSQMEELLKSLELRRPRLEGMLSTVLDTNSSVASCKPNYEEASGLPNRSILWEKERRRRRKQSQVM